ncbi:uncharacterized protein LOC126835504 isoform X2 [Adelges cooleyi]|uniref:uncharacterized protein LOC126835504 isoform X2 n=1 Tax=Adelges cooleyi TaxID=133065 RepID=UPI0021809164|nr:uncharacterized protein LOC126835504 isoform X2 [Adelges cooleyi]
MDNLFAYDLQLIYLQLLVYILLKNQQKNMFRLIETETKSTAVTTQLQVQSPSDPAIASVLHPRHTPRPGRILLENVNNRPQTMDRGTQANTATTILDTNDTPSTSNEPTNNELYRNANISVNNQKLLSSGGVSSSADSLNSADSAKRDNEDSVHESVESNQPMISKDNTDGHPNMSNGDGKFPGIGCDKPSNGIVKEYPVEDDADKTSCGMECLYFAMQCCECTIM